jgi:GPI-GlcNAc transferase complex, PIG-H component
MVCISDPSTTNQPLAFLPNAALVVGVAVLATNQETSTASWLHEMVYARRRMTATELLHSHGTVPIDETKQSVITFWMPVLVLVAMSLAALCGWIQSSTTKTRASTTAAVLTIYPGLGAQLSTETFVNNSKDSRTCSVVRTRRFLPRDQIVDCLVYEVVLSHKVQTVLAIRIHAGDKDDANQQPGTGKKDLKLIPVFPGTEMTYSECLYMRQEIMNALAFTE